MQKLLTDYVWEGGRHRIAHDFMIGPKEKGGFNMLDIQTQNASLKLSWINRLLSQTSNVAMWADYIMSCFHIPITILLRCNVSGQGFQFLMKNSIPQVWSHIFALWFNRRYIPASCSDKNRRDELLNSTFCFSAPIRGTRKITVKEVDIFNLLQENGITSWYDFIVNQANIIVMPAILPHDIHNALVDIRNKIPVGWKEIMGSDVSDHTDKTDLVSLCVEGRVGGK